MEFRSMPPPLKLCNTDTAEKPTVTASRSQCGTLQWARGGHAGGSLPSGPPAQQGPTHLRLRRDAASEGRASASLQAPTSVMLFWDKLQGHRGRAELVRPFPDPLPWGRPKKSCFFTAWPRTANAGQWASRRAVGNELSGMVGALVLTLNE